MAFAPRPRTPVRRQSNETSSGTVNPTVPTPVRATPSAASGTNGTIQRLLDIVTQHGVQLASLKEDQEALRREVLEALRGGTSSRGPGEKVPAEEVCKVASQKGRVGEGTTKAVSTETRRTSLCSTSSGSDAGGSTSSSRRSGRGTLPVPKVADLAKEKSSNSKASESEEKCHPVSAIPVPRLRSHSETFVATWYFERETCGGIKFLRTVFEGWSITMSLEWTSDPVAMRSASSRYGDGQTADTGKS
eukprot:symbB.v1.2.002915.t1/scaffold160.1/size429097/6